VKNEDHHSNIEAALEKVIYDANPEKSIESYEIVASDIQRYHQRVQTFIYSQLVYSCQKSQRTPSDDHS
jgi:hypothetical protein